MRAELDKRPPTLSRFWSSRKGDRGSSLLEGGITSSAESAFFSLRKDLL